MRQFKLVAAIAAVALVACGPQKVDPTLAILPAPRTIDGEGGTTTVRVVTTDNVGAPGSGTVHLVSAHGSLVDGTDITLADGEGTAQFSCDRATDADCKGSVKLTATWNDLTISTNVTVTGPHVPDAGITLSATPSTLNVGFNEESAVTVTVSLDGLPVAGREVTLTTTAGTLLDTAHNAFQSPATTATDGTVHALLVEPGAAGTALVTAVDVESGKQQQVTVTFALPDAGVFLTATPSTIYVNIGQSSDIEATLNSNGVPIPNRPLEVTTTSLAYLQYPDGGSFTSPGTTDSEGKVRLKLRDIGSPGIATVTATDPNTGRSASQVITLNAVGSINYTGATCSSVVSPACSIMGIAGSNFNTTASYNFTVRDSNNLPVSGVSVAFDLGSGAPSGTTLSSPTGITNANGIATAVVTAGSSIGAFTLVATVQAYSASVDVGVRGAKASSRGMTLQCSRFNLPAFRTDGQVLDVGMVLGWTTTCTVTLLDQRLNPIGTGQKVFLRTEAGGVPAEVSTTPYNPTGGQTANTNEGKATFTFSTVGPLPVDTDPFVALPANQHFPIARPAEPGFDAGTQVRNPRDGLVTIIAYTQGDEWYDDASSNNLHDPNEQFFDSQDPFVDSNDDDVPGPGEQKYPSNDDAGYRGLNNTWDQNVSIWTSTKILYTDVASISVVGTYDVAQNSTAPLTQDVPVIAWDKNYNIISGPASNGVLNARTGVRGGFQYFPSSFADTYGFTLSQREETNQDGTADCVLGVTPICTFRTRFTNWFDGYMGYVRVTGATSGTPESNSCTVRLTTNGSPAAYLDVLLAGTMQ